ncbi:MAG: site-specific DNA-methyltransferase [Chloroflexi bacterium]|nr:site-specific DNA-methyltransferase [Chloroflexota bacterium]
MSKGPAKPRRRTKTSAFGSNGRISHDSSAYYARAIQSGVALPQSAHTGEEQPIPPEMLNRIYCHTSEHMHELPDRSVHLMVTSPPYNVGKEYDDDLTLDDYLALLGRVLSETHRVLVAGGRACVNVANLGRKPYIPLHAYVIETARSAGFQMRGEIIWDKGPGAGVSTAWGSWMSASNPTLRDTHEYILVFQKPPFGRPKRDGQESTIERDEFLKWTKSVWTFGPESAKRAGHPAPFPVELPHRLIQLYTFEGDVVLDPFMGTGAAAIAALQDRRRYVGYDVSEEYCRRAQQRIEEVVTRPRSPDAGVTPGRSSVSPQPASTRP